MCKIYPVLMKRIRGLYQILNESAVLNGLVERHLRNRTVTTAVSLPLSIDMYGISYFFIDLGNERPYHRVSTTLRTLRVSAKSRI